MAIKLTPDIEVIRDEYEKVRALDHPRQPFSDEAAARAGVVALADAYLAEVAPIYQITSGALRSLESGDSEVNPGESERVRITSTGIGMSGSARRICHRRVCATAF